MAWNRGITAKNIPGMAEHYILRSDIEVPRWLVQKRNDLGLRQLQYMATCMAAKTLQSRCRWLEMVPDTPELWQAD
jgi:hypothetical protein